MKREDHSGPTYENQLWHARKLLQEKGPEALNNPHAMIGRMCGCGTCFCCAADDVYTAHITNERFTREHDAHYQRKNV